MFNKRFDAVKIKDLDALHKAMPYIMPKRTESEVSLNTEIDITELFRWLKEENETNGTNWKVFHAVCTAVGKTIFHRSCLNRFIAGRFYWQRNEILLSFTAKRQFADGAYESLIVVPVKEEYSIDDISKKILGDVGEMREQGKNNMDDFLDKLMRLPRWMLEIVFWFTGVLDYHALTPAGFAKGDSNYTTCMLTNLGSIGADPPYHHLNNYGTNSMMIAVGTYYDKKDEDGNVRKILPMSFTFDERMADGYYFIRSINYLKWLIANPGNLKNTIAERGEYEL